MLFGNGLEGANFVDARVVNEDVEAAVGLDGGVDDALRIRGLRNVASNGDGLAAMFCDMGDDRVRARLTGCIIDDHRCAFGGQRFCDCRSDAF